MESLPTSIQYLDKMTKVMDEYEPSPSQDVGKVSDVIMPLRASVRIAALQASKAVVEATEVGSNNESKTASVKPVEDEDDDSITLKPSKKYEMGGPIGAFLMSLLLPALCVYVHLACTRYSCTIKQLPVFLKYGSRDPALFYVGWILFQAVLTALPIGKVVEGLPVRCENGFSKLKYRMNGFITLVVNLLMLTSMLYFKCPVSFVYKNLFQLMVISILFSIFMSVALYIKGCRAPSYAQNEAGLSGCPQYDFFQGRELNPRVGKMFDLKLFLIHVGLIGWASVDLCLLYQSYEEFKHLNYPILFTVSCQFVFIFVNLWHADMFLTTAIVNCEGVGYLRVLSMCTLVPFLYSFPVIYLFQYRQEIPLYCLLSTGVVFCCGLYIYLQSNLEKNAFRRNPYSPSVSYLESIPTSKKKRLIVSGLWGTVRHPNYLGDILMNMAWTLPCGFGHFIPFIPALLAVMVLVTRAVREEGKCKQRYGPAWNRYTSQVRYRFIPYIF
ncbi:delta(14)-sterol reductase TM7SF2-like [Tachypleus tridentatus]|uniref:delta(14)-sterol reductase TM7SF2-like n=1 Tax=Tachypleus tridentatus TaxID=6853 RepID=UPI003FD344B5